MPQSFVKSTYEQTFTNHCAALPTKLVRATSPHAAYLHVSSDLMCHQDFGAWLPSDCYHENV